MQCSHCLQPIAPGVEISWKSCPHTMHSTCYPENTKLDYLQCPDCADPGGKSRPSKKPLAAPGALLEPRPKDGVDYVLAPGTKNSGAFSTIASWVPFGKVDVNSPGELIKRITPIFEIIHTHKMGLQHLLQAGVTMSDFLNAGYTLSDMIQFEDLGKKGPKRAMQTLTNGLKTDANHFRDFAHALPFAEVRELTKCTSTDLCTQFGLWFPDNGDTLSCNGDSRWGAKDCVELGLKMSDLMDFGMQTMYQYDALMSTLSRRDRASVESKLEITKADLANLATEAKPVVYQEQQQQQQEEEEEKIPPKVMYRTPQPPLQLPIRGLPAHPEQRAPRGYQRHGAKFK